MIPFRLVIGSSPPLWRPRIAIIPRKENGKRSTKSPERYSELSQVQGWIKGWDVTVASLIIDRFFSFD